MENQKIYADTYVNSLFEKQSFNVRRSSKGSVSTVVRGGYHKPTKKMQLFSNLKSLCLCLFFLCLLLW